MASEKILYVDDEEQIRKLLSGFLTRRGYDVATANDGLQALDVVGDYAPDLIITDVDMPNCDGIELTRRLRADPRTAHVPIIMLSAKSQTHDVLAGYAEGADEYVSKPIELAILGAKVETLLRRTQVRAAPLTHCHGAPTAASSRPIRGQIVVFGHAKGGAGATTLTVNAAAALAANPENRVFIVDLNLEYGDVTSLLGIDGGATLADLADYPVASLGADAFADLATEHRSGVRVIAGAAGPHQAAAVRAETVTATLAALQTIADYILVDLPPMFGEGALAALRAADLIPIVTAGRLVALNATSRYLAVLARERISESRSLILLNHPTSRGLKPDRVAEILGRRPDVVVPHLSALVDSGTTVRLPIETGPDSLGAIVARDLATRIAGVLAAAA